MSENHTTDLRSDSEQLINEIFELDAQYQGGIITAANREEFIELHILPLVKTALANQYFRGAAMVRRVIDIERRKVFLLG